MSVKDHGWLFEGSLQRRHRRPVEHASLIAC
jgi:hypothetical protein